MGVLFAIPYIGLSKTTIPYTIRVHTMFDIMDYDGIFLNTIQYAHIHIYIWISNLNNKVPSPQPSFATIQ